MTTLLLLLVILLGSACTIKLGLGDAGGDGSASPTTSYLPPPTNGSLDEPPLNEAEQARLEETERYTVEVIYKGGQIVQTIQLPSGDIVDFIARDTLPGLPYQLPELPFTTEDMKLLAGAERGLTELEQLPELAELTAIAVPYLRPTFWPYILGETDATSIEDYLARYQEGGQPSGPNRLYAGLSSLEPNHGVSGLMNQFRPEVASDSISLMELSVSCPAGAPAQEQIGIVISVDKRNSFGVDKKKYLDGEPRLHIEYARLVNGELQYNWDGLDGKFVANPFRLHHPGQKVPVSVIGGTQREHHMAIFQVGGDWWLSYDGWLLGYYPANLFTMLNGGACESSWYGEVFRKQTDTPNAIKTEMGSGRFPEAGIPNVAYIRNPKYHNLFGIAVEPQDDFSLAPYQPLCYGRAPLWDGILIISGPGGFNPGCQWP